MRATGFRLDPDWDIAGTVGSRGVASISFDFGAEWQGLAKRLTFYPKGETTGVSIIMQSDDEEILLPPEAYLKPGETTFVIDGVGDNGVKLISLRGRLRILDTAVPGGSEPSEPTPTELEQIRLALADVSGKADDMEENKIDRVDGGDEMANNIAVLNTDGGVTDSGIDILDVLTEHPEVEINEDGNEEIFPDNGGSFGMVADVERDENGHITAATHRQVTLPLRKSMHIGDELQLANEENTVFECTTDEEMFEISVSGQYVIKNMNDLISGNKGKFYVKKDGETDYLVTVLLPEAYYTTYLNKGDRLCLMGQNLTAEFVCYGLPDTGEQTEFRVGDNFINSVTGDLFRCTVSGGGEYWSEWEYIGKFSSHVPMAGPDTVGGVKPVEKEDYMTVPVGIDREDGRLYTVLFGSAEVSSWADIQRIVRSGLASQVFEIGDQFTCQKDGETLVWDVIGIDQDTPSDPDRDHSLTLQLHSPLQKVQYDAKEAFYYAESELPAGTYCIYLQSGYENGNIDDRNIHFTLTKSVPAGGVLCMDWAKNTNASEIIINSYSDRTDTTPLESVGIGYGTSGETLEKTNFTRYARSGSARWKNSAIRQYLNSEGEAGTYWEPQTEYDMPPVWGDSLPGFLKGCDDDFVAVLGKVKKNTEVCSLDGGGVDETEDVVFLPSLGEVYGDSQSEISEGDAYAYYSENSVLDQPGNTSDKNRCKYIDSTAVVWRLRSCVLNRMEYPRYVNVGGGIGYDEAQSEVYCLPVCCVV